MTLAQRLEKLSLPEPNSGCWLWLGSTRGPTDKLQYGRLIVGSRTDGSRRSISAHRCSYETFIGPIGAGLLVCHRCDNSYCINPEHLFLGTAGDNASDRERKGRNVVSRGESHGQSKLTVESIAIIRNSGLSNRQLAKMFSVDHSTIRSARSYKTWKTTPPQSGK